jgi:hypothetical protein
LKEFENLKKNVEETIKDLKIVSETEIILDIDYVR